MAPPLVEIRNLGITYRTDRGKVSAVEDVSLSIPRGGSIGLVGESGSGKSTIALAIMRLLPTNAHVQGQILFNGADLIPQPEAALNRGWRWKNLSMVFQKSLSAMSPVHRIGMQMEEVLRTHEPKLGEEGRKARIQEVLDAVHLPARVRNAYPFELSGGMMQRTMIALGLLCNPPFVIFDEATTALDVITQSQIIAEIQRLKAEYNLTIMVISHDVGVINATCDTVAVLYAGQLMEVAPRDQFFRNPQHAYSRALVRSIPRTSARIERISSIPGSLPDLTNPPDGRRFAPRRPHATGLCNGAIPPLEEVVSGHWVRCIHQPVAEGVTS